MKEKNVLITGGNKGIGFEIARQLGEKGFQIILTARNEERGKSAALSLVKSGIKTIFIKMDVSNSESISLASLEFKNHFDQLDVLVNNAAVFLDHGNDITKTNRQTFEDTLRTNSIGAFNVINEFLKYIPSGGKVINISSSAGALNGMSSYAPAYSTSKTALNAITLKFATVLSKKNIAVNSVCPGWVKTDMGGNDAPLSVSEGAETTVWLASEAPHNLTGKFFREKKEINW